MKIKLVLAFWIAGFHGSFYGFAQGNLTPPGAPAPTMKSLDQIEPRTPVDAAHTPGNGVAGFIITQPGSYYLTTNIVGVSGKRGIQIQANNVTLDLNGFSLSGVSGAFQGIYFPFATMTNVMVYNGIISGWTGGIYQLGPNGMLERLDVSGNAGDGIYCSDGCLIRGCTINGNGQNGIFVNGSGSLVVNNNCAGNNTANSASAAGISVWGSRNRVEGNHVTGSGPSGYGIYVANSTSYTNNIVIQNSVEGGGANNYSYNNSQSVGPLINVSGVITNSNPWANFSY